jgi:hypothetical protein
LNEMNRHDGWKNNKKAGLYIKASAVKNYIPIDKQQSVPESGTVPKPIQAPTAKATNKSAPSKKYENYMFIPSRDVSGKDVGNKKGIDNNPEKLMAACDANPRCVAIQSEGWMKGEFNSVGEINRSWVNNSKAGSYVKKSVYDKFSGKKPVQAKEITNKN